MSSLRPRVVLVSRETEYASLLAAHGTHGQAAFFLERRGQDIAAVVDRDQVQATALGHAKTAVPADWSFAHVLRKDLNRFLFSANDIVVAVGQDGLVANLAKYLDGQPVIGVSPDPNRTEGVLTRATTGLLPALLQAVAAKEATVENRVMVQAALGDGQTILALNELFIGHRSHQSARYIIKTGKAEEFQSSSGLIVATGTGLTGWAKSIMTATGRSFAIAPDAPRAAFFAREPWPSQISGTEIAAGEIDPTHPVRILSQINEGGVIFADGIEQDFLGFDWGMEAYVNIAPQHLHLVAG